MGMTPQPDENRTKVISTIAEPVHITLTKNSKGFNWEISIHGESVGQTLLQVEQAEAQLKAKYGAETA